MILFVGQIERKAKEREAFQELDYRAVFGSMTKWTAEIGEPARMAEYVGRAFSTAMAGRPGPVVLALPRDVLAGKAEADDALFIEALETAPAAADMTALENLIAHAKRPLLLLGGGRWNETACAAVTRFAERFQMPVMTSYRRSPLFDPLHPNYAGRSGAVAQSEIAGPGQIQRSGGRGGGAPQRDHQPGLHIVRNSHAANPAGACLSRRGRIGPRLSSPPSPSMPRRAVSRRLSMRWCPARLRPGRSRPARRMPNISPGRRPPCRSPAPSISAPS